MTVKIMIFLNVASWNAKFPGVRAASIFTIVYIFTYSTVQSPSWAANWFAASRETHRISRNPKVHYRTHKRPPPVSILGYSVC